MSTTATEPTECATAAKDERPRPPLSIRLSDELDAKLNAAVATTKLSRSDVARFSLEKGIPLLVAQMTGAPA